MNDYIIGVDIGTTNSKAVAYSFNGRVLAQSSSSYTPIVPQEGYHELNPEVLFSAVCSILRNVIDQCSSGHIAGVAFSSAMHGLIAVDAKGNPLTNMITWADLRSSAYARQLKGTKEGNILHDETGAPNHAMTPLCKLMWMKDNDTATFNNAYKFISIKEFVFFRFFKKYIVDHSVASSTGLFDIHQLQWNLRAIQRAGITEDKLSEHVPADYIVSGLQAEYAGSLGIPANTPFIIGGSDGCMAHIGSNALKPGDVSITIGTSGAVRTMNNRPLTDTRHRLFNYLVTDDLYLSGGPVNNGGNVLQWFATQFMHTSLQSPPEIEVFIQEALKVTAGAGGLVFLPYLYGERAPVWDADARGIFFGVSANHTLAHFMRAAMEGVCFSLHSILHSVEEINGPANDIFASGGFIRSAHWVQMLSDVLGKRLQVMHAEDSSAAGAAILGLKALGVISDFKDASSFFSGSELYEPDMKLHNVYQKNFDVYSKLYDKFKDIKL
jgi:gluconokinase